MLQCNSIFRIAIELHCSTILKQKNYFIVSIPLSVSRLSLHLSISNSLSFQSSLIPSLQTQNSIGTKTPDQCGGVEIGIWGLVQRSVFGCGVEIGIGLWVYCGFCLGLSWVAWVRIGVGDQGLGVVFG